MTNAGVEAARRGSGGMDGILVVDKPAGPTSHDIVALVRRLTSSRRVGHGGTLDPFASGVLPIFIGLATRLVEYHMGDSKAYRATVCFGAASTTDDRDGELTPGRAPGPRREEVEAALAGFRGPIEQRPPAFSAVQIEGRRAYQLAREGKVPELKTRSVQIDRLDLVDWDDSDPGRPVGLFEVECGAGTYVRSLARDLGEKLGCGAYLGGLVRTASGPFELAAARSLDDLRGAAAAGRDELAALLLPVDAGLGGIPEVRLTAGEVAIMARGQQVKPASAPRLEAGSRVRLLTDAGTLAGIGTWKNGRLVPDKVFVAPSGDALDHGGERSHSNRVFEAAPASEPPLRTVHRGNRMTVVPGIDSLSPELGPLYLAVGVFDGLHRGHQYLIRELRRAAARAGARPAIVTFDAHPEELIEGLAPPLLCDPDERLVRLEAAGVEVAVVQHFDQALRTTTYDRFVARIAERVAIAGFAMTPDAAFGHERRGTAGALSQLGGQMGFQVLVVPSYLLDGQQVRSSEIRKHILEGDLGGVRRLLGRPLAVTGRVEAGLGSSTRLAFELPVALPPEGGYEALVGPPWRLGAAAAPAKERRRAIVTAGGVLVEGAASAADWPRLVFVDRASSTGGQRGDAAV